MLYAVFVSDVFSLIFGHALIILPAVSARPIAYTPRQYAPLVLGVSLALRIAGDWVFGLWVRQWGGTLNVIAILLFLFLIAHGISSSKRAIPLSGASRARSPSTTDVQLTDQFYFALWSCLNESELEELARLASQLRDGLKGIQTWKNRNG